MAIWGLLSLPGTVWLSGRFIVEMVVWTHERGEQMVGFSLIHTTAFPILVILFLSPVSSWAFLLTSVYQLARKWERTRTFNKLHLLLLLAVLVSSLSLFIPYSFWQRVMILTLGPGKKGASLMVNAGFNDDVGLLESYLSHGVRINDRNHYDETALMQTAKKGNLTLAKHLLDQGADLHAETLPGDNVLTIAGEWKQYSFAREIHRKGARFVFLPDTISSAQLDVDSVLIHYFELEDSLKKASIRYKKGSDSLFARTLAG